MGPSETDAPVELAWALTVHKAQGSEFGLVVVMLPAGARRVSRELLYTALTRQTDRVVLCHEGPIDELLELTRASGSDTGRRMTDLTLPPDPVAVRTSAGPDMSRLDAGLVHVSKTGVLVRSKNELIIAGILEELGPGSWVYEQPFVGTDRSHPGSGFHCHDRRRPHRVLGAPRHARQPGLCGRLGEEARLVRGAGRHRVGRSDRRAVHDRRPGKGGRTALARACR
nr:helicase C-terminal domain-containing protein [Rhodococcus sp. 14C212]